MTAVPPTATSTPSFVPAPVSSPEPPAQPASALPPECSPGGQLTDAAIIASCNARAMEQVESFSFAMELNLAAMLPVSGDEPGLGAVRAEGSLVLPDRLRFTMRLGEADSEVVTTMIAVGSDVYVKDPLGSGWYKDSGGETDVSLVEQLRTLNQPTVAPTELVGLVDLEDGSRGYVLVVVAANDLEGFGGLVGEGTQTFIVDVEDFLTKQFTVEIEHDSIQQENGIQEENDSLVTVKFYAYNSPVDVSPPKDFTAFPTPQTGSPVPLVPHMAGILPVDTSTAGTVPRVHDNLLGYSCHRHSPVPPASLLNSHSTLPSRLRATRLDFKY